MSKKDSTPKNSSIRPAVSIEYRLVTDRRRAGKNGTKLINKREELNSPDFVCLSCPFCKFLHLQAVEHKSKLQRLIFGDV